MPNRFDAFCAPKHSQLIIINIKNGIHMKERHALLVRFLRKVRCVVLASSVRVRQGERSM